MSWDPQWMSKIPLLALLDAAAHIALVQKGRYAEYGKGKLLYREGERSDAGVAFVHKGRVQHGYVFEENGRELVIDVVVAPGMLGLEDAYAGMCRRNVATAIEQTRVLWVPADEMRRLIDGSVAMQRFMMDCAIKHSIAIERRLADKVFHSVRWRLATYLFEAVESLPDDERVVRLTQEQIASQIGTVRECVARLLSELRTIQVVRWRGESSHDGMEIIDPMTLYEWGQEGSE